MLYSICSMPFWINKSNLVCADKGWSLVSVIWVLSRGKLDLLSPREMYSQAGAWDRVVGTGGRRWHGYQKVALNSWRVAFFFGHAHSMLKFPGQGLNLCHRLNPRCRSDSARPLPCYATGALLPLILDAFLASLVHLVCWFLKANVALLALRLSLRYILALSQYQAERI